MSKKYIATLAAAMLALSMVGCGSESTTPTTAPSSSSSASKSSNDTTSTATTPSTAETETPAERVNRLLTKCAQDYYDIGDPLLDAIFANDTTKVNGFKSTIDGDISQLSSLTEVPEEYESGVEAMKTCLAHIVKRLACMPKVRNTLTATTPKPTSISTRPTR